MEVACQSTLTKPFEFFQLTLNTCLYSLLLERQALYYTMIQLY